MGWLLPNGNLFKDGAGNKTLTQNKNKKEKQSLNGIAIL